MALISIVICLFAERFLGYLQLLRNFSWFHAYAAFIINIASNIKFLFGKIGVLLILLPVPLLVGYLDYVLYQYFLPAEFLFGTAVLLFSFGPRTFYGRCKEFCYALNRQDRDSAQWFAKLILNRPLDESEKSQLAFTVTRNMFVIANERILGPILWFVLLGPMGAILYRLSSELRIQTQRQEIFFTMQKQAELFFAILNWMPARCAAFGFASMGNFLQALASCRRDTHILYRLNNHCSEDLLICVGTGSLNLSKAPEEFIAKDAFEALALTRRNYALWLGAIALLTLGGWLT